MADRTSRDGGTRRQAFRRVRADAGLPDEYLELLEQKRKQLDESIHKYIASKERDFKTFERELQQQYKQEQNQEGSGKSTRPSLGSTSNGAPAAQPRAPQQQQQQQSVVDALLAAGVNQEHIGQPLSVALVDADGSPRLEAKSAAGLIDRRASIERDKEFVGVFTPAFLPALETKASSPSPSTSPKTREVPERAESAPPAGQSKAIEQPTVIRAHSDYSDQAKSKRPVQLQLTHRTSSSGSSADGKLTSALKSPTQTSKSRRKRVSLAVGDSIVKPSDSVPTSLLNNNRTPSHSRRRSQPAETDYEQSIDEKIANGNGTKEVVDVRTTSPQVSASLPVESTFLPPNTNGQRQSAASSAPIAKTSMAPSSPLSRPPARPPVTIDPDGDLFDLEEEEDMLSTSGPEVEHLSESEDTITGRVHREVSQDGSNETGADLSSEAEPEEELAVEFIPGSAVASQQPTQPGFRRPSVAMDPIYAGANYNRAEYSAVVNEVYGSSYDRPKRSFTSGSLGESFMARNAQHMRARAGSKTCEQPVVRS
ncbi:uncharacterized protein RCC_00732 [Ramularia collo-cygni]|uniref:Uncharacterized protein n=1 Tax=Ramularia collo-cygni TaxID=112498 RepID=A0A2D3UNA1_9PEZI|nr:uncharacterized protein RCC_00732 [Ramularia collo-cygni]CZT14778.1 uncharacterized protein RCC_00732 [Ramularia collo-cygni]